MKPLPSLYKNGLRFSCTGCGNCCSNHGEYNAVYLTKQDVSLISNFLKLSKNQFQKKFTRGKNEEIQLKDRENTCIFLNEKRQCEIYPVRPLQCRTFPFWPENLNPRTWKSLHKNCPGIGQGPIIPKEKIELYLSWDKNNQY